MTSRMSSCPLPTSACAPPSAPTPSTSGRPWPTPGASRSGPPTARPSAAPWRAPFPWACPSRAAIGTACSGGRPAAGSSSPSPGARSPSTCPSWAWRSGARPGGGDEQWWDSGRHGPGRALRGTPSQRGGMPEPRPRPGEARGEPRGTGRDLVDFREHHQVRLRASGGIGRRARFRSVCPKGRGGSTPPSRTTRQGPGVPGAFVVPASLAARGVARCPRPHPISGTSPEIHRPVVARHPP